jgi:hypothetical protein
MAVAPFAIDCRTELLRRPASSGGAAAQPPPLAPKSLQSRGPGQTLSAADDDLNVKVPPRGAVQASVASTPAAPPQLSAKRS